ncbi:MAG TPA: glycosyltransferase family 39 protein [bacterium]|nr:glycosyltransferase family 39 protein [bacterium]
MRRREALILGGITALALLLRLVALTHWIDAPGDGVVYAKVADDWARSPYLPIHEIFYNWLPGYVALTGLFGILVPDPWLSTRILNVVLGTCCIPVFFFLVRNIYGPVVAVFSALFLAVLPLHVALSATSMPEVSIVVEILAGTALFIRAAGATKNQGLYLIFAIASLVLAMMTRWETWLLIPLFPSYYFLKTRNARTAAWILIVLVALPAACVVSSYRTSGDLTHQISALFTGSRDTPVMWMGTFARGLVALGRIAVRDLGLLALAAVWGTVVQIRKTLSNEVTLEGSLHLWLALIFWPLIVYMAAVRGYTDHRGLLFVFVIVLPFTIVPIIRHPMMEKRWLIAALTVVALASIGVGNLRSMLEAESGYRSPLDVTRVRPTEITNLAHWLAASPYRDDAVLMTALVYDGGQWHEDWTGSYLWLYFPANLRHRLYIISSMTQDADVQSFVARYRPTLFIGYVGEEKLKRAVPDRWAKTFTQTRVEAVLKTHLTKVVRTEGSRQVYLIATK